jgi:hypothetical protein
VAGNTVFRCKCVRRAESALLRRMALQAALGGCHRIACIRSPGRHGYNQQGEHER